MVKKHLILFIIFILCTGCEKIFIDNSNFFLERTNLSKEIVCGTINDSFFPHIHPDSITENDFNSFKGKNELSTEFVRFIEPKVLYYLYNDSLKIDYNSLSYFACGKISLRTGVDSYLVLRQLRKNLKFVLLNFRKKNIVSITLLSTTGIYHDVPYLKTYINYECKTLCLIDHSFLHGIDYCPITKDDIWSKLGITKPKSLKYFYSTYTIDENGYVKTIPFEKEDFPNYMNY